MGNQSKRIKKAMNEPVKELFFNIWIEFIDGVVEYRENFSITIHNKDINDYFNKRFEKLIIEHSKYTSSLGVSLVDKQTMQQYRDADQKYLSRTCTVFSYEFLRSRSI